MVLTVCFALSPVTGLSCHRRSQIIIRKLDISVGISGPHDFAVRVNVARRATLLRPPHPASRFVTIAHTPLLPRRDGREMPLICRRDQLRQIGTTGKSVARAKMLSMKFLPLLRGAKATKQSQRRTCAVATIKRSSATKQSRDHFRATLTARARACPSQSDRRPRRGAAPPHTGRP
jgi:hypothetical protein